MARSFWRKPLNPGPGPTPPGEVHIIPERCKGCGFCIEFCPRSVLGESREWNRRGYHPPEVLRRGLCAECHFCELLCPEFAIYVTRGAGDPVPATGAATGPATGKGEGGFDV